MLCIQIIEARGLTHPSLPSPAPSAASQDDGDEFPHVKTYVVINHGAQTVKTPKSSYPNPHFQPHLLGPAQEQHMLDDDGDDKRRNNRFLEVWDREGSEVDAVRVEVLVTVAGKGRQGFRHSHIVPLSMGHYRDRPEQRADLWLPLYLYRKEQPQLPPQPAESDLVGQLHLIATYSDDVVHNFMNIMQYILCNPVCGAWEDEEDDSEDELPYNRSSAAGRGLTSTTTTGGGSMAEERRAAPTTSTSLSQSVGAQSNLAGTGQPPPPSQQDAATSRSQLAVKPPKKMAPRGSASSRRLVQFDASGGDGGAGHGGGGSGGRQAHLADSSDDDDDDEEDDGLTDYERTRQQYMQQMAMQQQQQQSSSSSLHDL